METGLYESSVSWDSMRLLYRFSLNYTGLQWQRNPHSSGFARRGKHKWLWKVCDASRRPAKVMMVGTEILLPLALKGTMNQKHFYIRGNIPSFVSLYAGAAGDTELLECLLNSLESVRFQFHQHRLRRCLRNSADIRRVVHLHWTRTYLGSEMILTAPILPSVDLKLITSHQDEGGQEVTLAHWSLLWDVLPLAGITFNSSQGKQSKEKRFWVKSSGAQVRNSRWV